MSISDRLAVIYNGSIVGIIDDPRSTDAETLGLMMAGVRQGSQKDQQGSPI
jgi:simple sugar transport system ATP-binding protein